MLTTSEAAATSSRVPRSTSTASFISASFMSGTASDACRSRRASQGGSPPTDSSAPAPAGCSASPTADAQGL
eukprot:CAMPEP_0179209776 /NCGR_PEP_ID=MMETSP0796-20121207/104623_1 /TAXON_ID=73915 /ORGANISM="Pyrodinium bahamense, Strain pbaha01" /LENGTH=71 /DNA_ID=CAMNT_0020914735 /DNA_START=514 /DNA_END=726 /DNA_ORIENTATION=+